MKQTLGLIPAPRFDEVRPRTSCMEAGMIRQESSTPEALHLLPIPFLLSHTSRLLPFARVHRLLKGGVERC